MKWDELIKDSAWVVEDLLTMTECQKLLHRANMLKISSKTAAGDVRHRNSMTVALDDEELAAVVFDRIRDLIPQVIKVDEDCSNPGLCHSKEDLYGTWKPYGLNHRWRIVCYPGRGHFGPHRDGCYLIDEHHRSLITINGYLTDRPIGYGGATRFVKDDIDVHFNEEDGIFTTAEEDVIHRVEADKAGKAVVFLHDLMHDGEPLNDESPPKWLFRTEILYERDPTTSPQLTPQQVEARDYLKRAEAAENCGDICGATMFYKRAYWLDMTLDGLKYE